MKIDNILNYIYFLKKIKMKRETRKVEEISEIDKNKK